MGAEPDSRIDLRLIGPMAVHVQGVERPLTASKKTRALLGYLAIENKPQRRERLCELFWDLPDDPRGSLRWSLSKLRGILDGGGAEPLRADREWVTLDLTDASVDWRRLRALVRSGPASASTEELTWAAAHGGELLQGLDLPRCEIYQSWCLAHREDALQWRCAVLAELSGRDVDPEEALAHARARVELDPFSPSAWENLVGLLDRTGREQEASRQRSIAIRQLGEAQRHVPAALRARSASPKAPGRSEPRPTLRQDIRFCTASDGTGLAYSTVGSGPPIVKTANWMSHLEFDWDSPIWRHWIEEFSRGHTFLRYDERGNGLSDWQTEFSFEGFVDDFESVVEAAGLDRFDLIGISQGVSVAIAYAARHPERVRKMVLLGGFAQGWGVRADPAEVARRQAMLTLTLEGWGMDNPAFRQMFTSLFLPDSSAEHQRWFNELQQRTTSPENAHRIQLVLSTIDVTALLDKVSVPTLVAHCRGDGMVPFEAGRSIARAIPGAQFVALDSRNHMLLEGEPAWSRFVGAVRDFLGADGDRAA